MTKGSTKFFFMLYCLIPHKLWHKFNNLCKDPLLTSSTDKIPSVSNSHASNHPNHHYRMVLKLFTNFFGISRGGVQVPSPWARARLYSSFLTESSGSENVQLWRLDPSEASCLLSWLLCLLDHSLWVKAVAMFWAALWRDPDAREARESHRQYGMKSSGPQSNS